MTTKLIDMNVGIQLTLLVDGKQKMVTWSMICPSQFGKQPYDVVFYAKQFLEDELGIDLVNERIEIAKPKRIKAHRAVSQEEFNKRIQELQP